MKNTMWMVSVAIIAAIQFGCSKKNELSPDDTALIKGTDRGTFVGSGEDGSLADEGELSPLGTAITGLDGSDGLLPQDPFWDEPGRMDNPERPFEPIFFGFDQYNVGAAERAKLQDVAGYLSSNPDAKILIEGYCDWKGTPAYNKSLGDRRAGSVKSYLIDLGIDQNRIEIISMGDEMATPDADPTTAGLERKAQFIVLKDS